MQKANPLHQLPEDEIGLRGKARRLEKMLRDTFPVPVLEGKDAFDAAIKLLSDYALNSRKLSRVFGPFVNFDDEVYRPSAVDLIRDGIAKGQIEKPAPGDTLTTTSEIPGGTVEVDNFRQATATDVPNAITADPLDGCHADVSSHGDNAVIGRPNADTAGKCP